MAKLSERTECFNGIMYKRKVVVSAHGAFSITLPDLDGLPPHVSATTLTAAEGQEREILSNHINLDWKERKVIRILYSGLKDNSAECVMSTIRLASFNGFGYSVQAGVLTERYCTGSSGKLYEYQVEESALPGTVDYPCGRVNARIDGLIPYDEKVIAMLCDIIAKTNMLSAALADLLKCEDIALKAADYDPNRLLG